MAVHTNFQEINKTFKKVILFVEKIHDDKSSYYAFFRDKKQINLFHIDPVSLQLKALDMKEAMSLNIKPKF